MTGPRLDRKATPLTPAQSRLLAMLAVAYQEDIALRLGSKTCWTGEDHTTTASRTVSRALVVVDLAYYSPEGTYLLLSNEGKRRTGIASTSRPTRRQSVMADLLS